jgi:acyl-CoA thioester hydrolase
MSSPWIVKTKLVEWHEVDAYGRVYYGDYAHWCDLGRQSASTAACIDPGQIFMVTTDFYLKYRAPARFNEEVVIRTRVASPTLYRWKFEYEIYRKVGRELCAEGYSLHILLDADGKPKSHDPVLLEKLAAFFEKHRERAEVQA